MSRSPKGAKLSLANAETTATLVDRLRSVTPESRRRWGRMTAAEMLCHLADASECAFGRRDFVPVDHWFGRTVVKFVALRAPMRWPPNIPTRPEFDVRAGGTRPREFEADRARALSLLLELANLTEVPPKAAHPIFGRLSLWEWKRWGYLHVDHHLRQFSA